MQKYPIDFDVLKKGDRITTEELEDILQLQAGTAAFDIKSLKLKATIERELAKRGKDFIIVFRQESIWVLTDAESVEYIDTMNRRGVKKIVRAYDSLGKVNPASLNSDQLRQFNRSTIVVSAFYQSVKSAVKVIPPDTQRTKMGLPQFTNKSTRVI